MEHVSLQPVGSLYASPELRHVLTTVSGREVNLADPRPEQICLEDIAHSLAYSTRYNGHLPVYYSTAQHCVHVAESMAQILAEERRDMWLSPGDWSTFLFMALLHDAAEAYTGDMISPLKALLPEYKVIEARVQAVVCEHFNLPHAGDLPDIDALIHEADMRVFAAEWLVLGRRPVESFAKMEDPGLYRRRFRSMRATTWEPEKAKHRFLEHARAVWPEAGVSEMHLPRVLHAQNQRAQRALQTVP